ncbi:MAG TPA: hypothetical protein PL096_04145 [Micropepsaceae bacterium]|nr:hypothetical protein [Micropepsaceae bacterium]
MHASIITRDTCAPLAVMLVDGFRVMRRVRDVTCVVRGVMGVTAVLDQQVHALRCVHEAQQITGNGAMRAHRAS